MLALVGSTESITEEEAAEFETKALDDLIRSIVLILDKAYEDEEVKAEQKVVVASQIGRLKNAAELHGVLMGPDGYLSTIPYGETARIEEVS